MDLLFTFFQFKVPLSIPETYIGLELKRCNTKVRLYLFLEVITSYIFQFADELRHVTRKVRYIKAALLSHLVGRLCRYYVPSRER